MRGKLLALISVVSLLSAFTSAANASQQTHDPCAVIDDMESYEESCDANAIWEIWKDGAGDCGGIGGNGTGSSLWLGFEPCEPVHSGAKSMEYWYDNSREMHEPSWSVASLFFSEPQDWAALGAKVLTLYFYGDPNNDANATEQMYVALEDSNGVYAEVRYPLQDMEDIKVKEWQRWNIPLTDFNDVNSAIIERLRIGFGEEDNWEDLGGSGVVYFDDIRLYATACIPKYGPLADFNNDCFVGFEDYAILASQWFQPPSSPSADIAPEPPDSIVEWQDLFVLTDSWLQEQLWPLP